MPFLKLGERGVDPNTQQDDAHEVRLCRPASDDENWWGRINCKWLLFTGIRASAYGDPLMCASEQMAK
jgi:hypothetical protein